MGETTLDRVHQAMILFAAGRDQRFWRLAQALSALYRSSTGEKRWVDGVLARKKGLGLWIHEENRHDANRSGLRSGGVFRPAFGAEGVFPKN